MADTVNTSVEQDTGISYEHELIAKVREHKHNYAEDFGLAVSVPAQAVFDEMISQPDTFSIDEKEAIVKAFVTSIECRSAYEGLGLPIHIQLNMQLCIPV